MNTKRITGKVIKVLRNRRIVINRGKIDGVELGQKYQVYRMGEMLTDPKTGESLGALESTCGYGRVDQLQAREATLTLDAVPPKVVPLEIDTSCHVRRISSYSPRVLHPSPLFYG